MSPLFRGNGYGMLIGSMPLSDHAEAHRLVRTHTPEIPLWVQLPVHPEEGMMAQFAPGLPGLDPAGSRVVTDHPDFDRQLLAFYEEYMAVAGGEQDPDESRFVLSPETAQGFFTFLEQMDDRRLDPEAVKGQITGPFTFCTGVPDQEKRAIFYNEQLRDAAIKLLALKAAWQVRHLSVFGKPVILFVDEPALAGFGSSEFISISREEIAACLNEVVEAIHGQGGLAGIHICANTDWSLAIESSFDIVNFDAYAYFERFILYAEGLKRFLTNGKILAWGIVPTTNVEDIEKETAASLANQWEAKVGQVEALGFDHQTLLAQSLITPSCGVGSLSRGHAEKVLQLTRELAEQVRRL